MKKWSLTYMYFENLLAKAAVYNFIQNYALEKIFDCNALKLSSSQSFNLKCSLYQEIFYFIKIE